MCIRDRGEIVRMGKDIVVFACGLMVSIALEAAELLAAEGISVAVADIHTLSLIHISLPDKEAADGIENHQRAGIAQMDIVINSGTATVYAYLPRLNGDKLLFARMLGIIEPDRHGILPFIDSNISTARLRQTAVLLR